VVPQFNSIRRRRLPLGGFQVSTKGKITSTKLRLNLAPGGISNGYGWSSSSCNLRA
jgi:hypothetical protein